MKDDGIGNFPLFEGEVSREKIIQVRIDHLQQNPYQPRRSFPKDKIAELTQSIRTYGLLHPIIVRRLGRVYQIVAGERRVIACRNLGWKSIPATVKALSDSDVAAMALIENLQRENLGYFDEAEGYARLIQTFNLTQEVLAQRLGKSQSTIANKMRLLKLPDEIKDIIVKEQLSERHARALLKLDTDEQQKKVLREIIQGDLTVSDTEKRIRQMVEQKEIKEPGMRRKGKVRDLRIFLNTIRQAVKIIEDSGLRPEVEEKVEQDYIEVTIRLFKGAPS
ncbi:MAG: nucleoid occlusion protein [Firmicutes bacterium]|nr:nucleoid occlusion protein [Bacillota bacterium]